MALNILAMLSDLVFGPDPDERMARPRQAKHLRRMLLCVPGRVIHHARGLVLRLPAGLRWADASARAYARGLSPPAWARAAAITMRGAHRGAAIPKDGRDRAHDRLSVRDRADSGGPNPLEAPQPTSPISNARSAPVHESRSEPISTTLPPKPSSRSASDALAPARLAPRMTKVCVRTTIATSSGLRAHRVLPLGSPRRRTCARTTASLCSVSPAA